MTPRDPLSNLRSDEQGFTLVEMLVAMTMGVIVLGATFAILNISQVQSARIIDRVSADQRSRTAMEKLSLRLHSSCVSIGDEPILEKSSETLLRFLSQTGSEAAFTTVTMHEVSLSGETLIDKLYTSNPSLTGTKWKFTSPPTTTTLLTGVSRSENGTAPLFRYYRYTSGQLSATPLPVPLNEENANVTAQVTVRFTTAPASGSKRNGRPVDLENNVSLRLTPPTAIGANEPCE